MVEKEWKPPEVDVDQYVIEPADRMRFEPAKLSAISVISAEGERLADHSSTFAMPIDEPDYADLPELLKAMDYDDPVAVHKARTAVMVWQSASWPVHVSPQEEWSIPYLKGRALLWVRSKAAASIVRSSHRSEGGESAWLAGVGKIIPPWLFASIVGLEVLAIVVVALLTFNTSRGITL